MILSSTVFVCIRVTERQTDGRAIAYSALRICYNAVARWKRTD